MKLQGESQEPPRIRPRSVFKEQMRLCSQSCQVCNKRCWRTIWTRAWLGSWSKRYAAKLWPPSPRITFSRCLRKSMTMYLCLSWQGINWKVSVVRERLERTSASPRKIHCSSEMWSCKSIRMLQATIQHYTRSHLRIPQPQQLYFKRRLISLRPQLLLKKAFTRNKRAASKYELYC